MTQNGCMAKKKTESDRHKPSRMIRVRERIARQAEALANAREMTLTEAVNQLIIRGLEQEGLWPPPKAQVKEER